MLIDETFNEGLENWYSLFVKTGAEDDIVNKLSNMCFDSLRFHVPKREMKIRRGGTYHIEIKTMFPGYILVHGELTLESYTRIKQINDVYTWIHDDNGPLLINQNEINTLKILLDDQDVIRISKVFYEGNKVVILDGPLLGNEAIIRKVDRRKERVKVAVSMYGIERLINISIESISSRA